MPQEAAITGSWEIDPAHSRVGFSTRHAMVSRVRGAFSDVSGEALIDGGDVASSTVSVVIGTASVDTRNEGRDEHLRSADFFNVEEYPEMRFEATGIDEVDENSFVVTGPLTIRGVTKTVSLPLELIGINTDHMGMLRAGLEGTRRIDRKDWEVSWNKALDSSGLLVSDKITLEFELSLIKSQDPEVPSKSSQDKRSS
jgi:polyisoprenoid-binding protein YceI